MGARPVRRRQSSQSGRYRNVVRSQGLLPVRAGVSAPDYDRCEGKHDYRSIPVDVGQHSRRVKASAGLSVSTYLDRSSATTSTREARISDQDVTVFETVQMLGAINDVRLALGWGASRKLQIGAGAHVFTGQNRVFFSQTFPDSLKFTPVVQTTTLGFTGFAASAGAIVRPSPVLALAVSGRKGGALRSKSNDSTVSEANVPDRYSAALSYEGITGASISAQVARETWSAMNGLGSDASSAVDAWEGGLGIETAGPRIAERLIVFRAGSRYRTLPFLAAGAK